MNVLGFIDNYSSEENIIRPASISGLNYDYVLVLSPNYWLEISKSLPGCIILIGDYPHVYFSPGECIINGTSIDKINADLAELSLLKDVHKGERAFLIGNGPSLRISDLELLTNEVTIACNKIFLSYSDTSWRPSYYTLVDSVHMDSCYEYISLFQDSTCFYPLGLEHTFPVINRGLHYCNLPSQRKGKRGFLFDVVEGVVGGNQVTYSMFQLLIYMGISEIILLGVDFNYILPNRVEGSKVICEGEINHFHKDYFTKGDTWTDPDLGASLIDFEVISEVASNKGVKIINATRGGHLEFFDRVDFDSLVI